MLVLRFGAIIKKQLEKPLPALLQKDILSDGHHCIVSSKNMLGFASSIDTFFSTEEIEELKFENRPSQSDINSIKEHVKTRFPIDWYIVHIDDS